ncbi:MAG: hypothetical protein HY692_01405 [Cyanobacteria bacterium NC_groundwater_1444_Ag_S-0.65um_54_12]|nr:hypothetical protein [Cyanobacteria bacterium NC_groundwater_1444_Ag_S-0.65um_54_12]
MMKRRLFFPAALLLASLPWACVPLSAVSKNPQDSKASPAILTGDPASSDLSANESDVVPLGEENAELAELLESLDNDADYREMMHDNPLINDGGAVFLDETDSNSYRITALTAVSKLPRWRYFQLKAATGSYDTAIRCTDPGELSPNHPAGYISACLDRQASTAHVTIAQRISGIFALDLYPYVPDFLIANTMPATSSVGSKAVDGLAITRARFVRKKSGWAFRGISLTRGQLLPAASQSIQIAWAKALQDKSMIAEITDPLDIKPRLKLSRLPLERQITAQVKVLGDPEANVFVSDGSSKILRLYDDGTHGDEQAGDQIYSARYKTPATVRPVYKILVQAIANHTLANETANDYDVASWAIPVKVE